MCLDAAIRRESLLIELYRVDELGLVDEDPGQRERVGRTGAVLRENDGDKTVIEGDNILPLFRVGERFRRSTAYDEVNALLIAPTAPSGEQSREGVCESVLECRHNNAAGGAGHSLHHLQGIRSGD